MLQIAIVEDDAATRETLQGFVEQYAAQRGLACQVTPYADGSGIVQGYRPGFDIIFMDVEMPGTGGFSAAEQIRAVDSEVVLVFVTNMAQYAIRGYEVDALDYVLKPVDYYQFSTKLSRAVQRIQQRRGAGRSCCNAPGAGSSCWRPPASTIWRPTAGCCTITRRTEPSPCGPACKAPRRSWPPTILPGATSAIWST